MSSSSSSSSQSWYQFQYWELSFSGGDGTLYWNGIQISSGSSWNYANTYGSFTYDCPSGLTQNVTATISGTAYYQKDYVTLSGPTSVTAQSSPTTASYTLSWSISPYNAYQVDWSVTQGYSYQVKAQLLTSGGTYSVTWTTNVHVECPVGYTVSSINESINYLSISLRVKRINNSHSNNNIRMRKR